MDVRVAPETRAALDDKHTLRCVLKVNFKRKIRHSVPVISWATSLVHEVTHGLLKEAERNQGADDPEISMNVINLMDFPKHDLAFICFDIVFERLQ